MSIFDRIKAGWTAATLPTVPLPKAPNGPQGLPGYRKTVVPTTSAVRATDRLSATTDRAATVRNLGNTKKAIRELTKTSPDLSSSVSFLNRVGIPERYTLVARNLDGRIDPIATSVAHELVRRLTFLGNVDGSMGVQQGLQSLSEQLALELQIEGAACLEVALDKARVPASMNPIAISTLKFYEEPNSVRIVQVIGGQEIDLDLPTIIYTTVDQSLTEATPSSYLEAAVAPILADIDFNNDMRNTLKRAVLPRLTATINSERVKAMTPPEILADAVKFAEYKQTIIDSVETTINGLAAEDALVSFDAISYAYIDGGKDPSAIIARIQEVLNSKLASGSKTLPTVLGHGSNSNASSTEALLYVKQANMIRVKLNEMYSRAFTIATRILGHDVYVEFAYASIDLRPESELEAYKAMEQSRVLELLSLGMLTDDEACVKLTGNLPPAGYKPLSGTMFKSGNTQIANPASNTSAISQSLTPDTPKQPKSTKAEMDTASLLATANKQATDAMERTDKAVAMVQDLAYVLAKQADKPVNVSVEPAVVSLQIEQEKKTPSKKVKVIRDDNGRVSHMEVQHD